MRSKETALLPLPYLAPIMLQAQLREREVEGQMQHVAELMSQLSLAQDLLQQALNGVDPGKQSLPSTASKNNNICFHCKLQG